MKRLFLAIKILPDENMLSIFDSIKRSLNFSKVRWVDPNNFHLTIKFFGETPDDAIEVVNRVIRKSIESVKSFDIELSNTGIFGSNYNPRIIWFGITENEKFQKIAQDIIINLDTAGFIKDRQNFVPHLTVGRIKNIVDKKLFNEMIIKVKNIYFQKIIVDEIYLYESILTAKQPIYKIVETFRLK